MLAIVIAEGVAILLLAGLVMGLLRSHAEILRSLHELGAGVDIGPTVTPGPVTVQISDRVGDDISGPMLDGTIAAIGIVGAPHNTLLGFLSSTCTTCLPFWDGLPTLALPPDTRLVVVVQDEDSDKRLNRLAPTNRDDVVVVKSTTAWERYEIPGSPHFVLVAGSHGRILGEGTGSSWDQVFDLLAHSAQLATTGADVTFEHDHPDNPTRIDAELAAAGVMAGHPSLYRSLDPPSL